MALFFTVDRLGSLSADAVLSKRRYADVGPAELRTHVDQLFPDGVTSFGERYLLRSTSGARLTEPNIELLWEYVRRARFPNAPSRFESVFAVDSIEEGDQFRTRFGQAGSIWSVEANLSFRADMSLLTIDGTILVVSHFADLYWSQRTRTQGEPFWEQLLIPPVRVLERVG